MFPSQQMNQLESQLHRLTTLAIEGVLASESGIVGGMRLAGQLIADSTNAFETGDRESFVLSRLAAIGMLTVLIENQRRQAAAVERN